MVVILLKEVCWVGVVGMVSWIVYVYSSAWVKSERVRRKLRMQGIRGPPPSFLYGNLPHMQRLQAQAKLLSASPSPSNNHHSDLFLAHDYTSTLFPYFEHWRKEYGNYIHKLN